MARNEWRWPPRSSPLRPRAVMTPRTISGTNGSPPQHSPMTSASPPPAPVPCHSASAASASDGGNIASPIKHWSLRCSSVPPPTTNQLYDGQRRNSAHVQPMLTRRRNTIVDNRQSNGQEADNVTERPPWPTRLEPASIPSDQFHHSPVFFGLPLAVSSIVGER